MIVLGDKLQQARLDKGLSLEDVSKSTKIKTEFLSLIEEGKYDKLPSATHAQGFVRNYSKFLGLDEKETMAIFRREYDQEKAYRVLPKGFEAKNEFPVNRRGVHRTVILIAFIFLIFIAYLLFQYRYAFLNPPLNIISPKDQEIISSSQVSISGKTDPNATVYINKNAVSVDSNGSFKKIINVFPGKTLIDIRVINKFSRETDRKVEIDVKGNS